MLLEFQRDVAAFLLHRAPPPAAVGRAPGAAIRFGIYRNNVAGNIAGALSGAYPSLHRALGDAGWRELAAGFAAASPPAEADLHRYGEGFAQHVARALPAPPWLCDLARLDWASSCALHAPDAPALTCQTPVGAMLLEAAPRGGATAPVVLRPHPSLRLLALGHRVRALREALLGEDDAAALAASRDVASAGERLAVLRGSGGITVLALAPAAFRLATRLAGGLAVTQALAGEEHRAALKLFLEHGFFSTAEVA